MREIEVESDILTWIILYKNSYGEKETKIGKKPKTVFEKPNVLRLLFIVLEKKSAAFLQ